MILALEQPCPECERPGSFIGGQVHYVDGVRCAGPGPTRRTFTTLRPVKLCQSSGERMWGERCTVPSEDEPCAPMYAWIIPGLSATMLDRPEDI